MSDGGKTSDLDREIWKLKQLFVDMTFCCLNPGITQTLYNDTIKDFKEIVGDDPEFVVETENKG